MWIINMVVAALCCVSGIACDITWLSALNFILCGCNIASAVYNM